MHEAIVPVGNVVYSEIAVTHRKLKESTAGRNIGIYEMQKAEGEPFSPRDQFYYGRELYYNARYEEATAIFQNFLNEGKGWVENEIEACRMIALCYEKTEDHRAARAALLQSFEYDNPRAEVCCDLGAILWQKRVIPRRYFGINKRLLPNEKIRLGRLSCPNAMVIYPAFNFACAMIGWAKRESPGV